MEVRLVLLDMWVDVPDLSGRTVSGDSSATRHGLAGPGFGNRDKMLEMYEAGGDQSSSISKSVLVID